MRRIRKHLTYANVMATLAVFLVLSGGTAVALNGANTVQSDDLGPGSQVKAADVADNAVNGADVVNDSISGADVNEPSLNLAAEPWSLVGPRHGTPFNATDRCRWGNYDPGVFNAAAFTRDSSGFVHLKGIVDADAVGANIYNCTDDAHAFHSADDYLIFTLPPGYRPAQGEVHATVNAAELGRINVSPNGWVHFEDPTTFRDATTWISLDGITFRCAPSGQDGCP